MTSSSDPRLNHILRNLLHAFKTIPSQTYETFTNSPETLATLYEFLDSSNPEYDTIYFLEPRKNILVCQCEPPKNFKSGSNVLYFTKAESRAISLDNFKSGVIQGDLSLDVLRHLGLVVQGVYLPLLSNSKSQSQANDTSADMDNGTGTESGGDGGQNQDMITRDLMLSLDTFVSNIQIMSGNVDGVVRLPLPVGDSSIDNQDSHDSDVAVENAVVDDKDKTDDENSIGIDIDIDNGTQKDKLKQLESLIITWTKQIKQILKQEPSHLLESSSFPNPGPLAELKFWNEKAKNLNAVFNQLQSPRVRRLLRFLDQSKSTYNAPFGKLCKEVFSVRTECIDNCKFLRPLQKWFVQLESESESNSENHSFSDLIASFNPILHLILLVWKGSSYYNTTTRLVVLVREICNTLVTQSSRYISGDKVFEMIANDDTFTALQMLQTVIRVLGTFKQTYLKYKNKANAECPNNSWKVSNNAIFVRLDIYLERLHDIYDLTSTIAQFQKLCKIEIGGTKGKTLTTSVQQIYLDFQACVDVVKNVEYDVLNIDVKSFEDNYYTFRSKIKELDRRLSSVITQGFDDCSTVSGRFKLLDSFDSLLLRSTIKDELEVKHSDIISSYSQDVQEVLQIFTMHKNTPQTQVYSNLPPIAGALTWCRGLLDRVRLPMDKIKSLDPKVLDRDDARDVVKVYTNLLGQLAEFERGQIEMWGGSIEVSSQNKLKNTLLRKGDIPDDAPRNSQELLYVNFAPSLTKLLREVKYFILLGLNVPDSAMEIYTRGEVFRRYRGNLELIVNAFNKIQTNLLPVERPLLKSQLIRINKIFTLGVDSNDSKQALKSKVLNWKSNGIDNFITEAMAEVKAVDSTMSVMKSNLRRIEVLLDSWTVKPLFERTTKTSSVDDFEGMLSNIRVTQYKLIKSGGMEIHKLLKATNRELKVSQGLPDWKCYVDFINNVVITGLVDVVVVALDAFEKNLDGDYITKNNLSPLLEIDLDLHDKIVIYKPEIKSDTDANANASASASTSTNTNTADKTKVGLRTTIFTCISTILGIGSVFKRLDSGEGTYINELHSHPQVAGLMARINGHVKDGEVRTNRYRRYFEKYEYLWVSDFNEIFKEFLATAIQVEDVESTLSINGESENENEHESEKKDDTTTAPHETGTETKTKTTLDLSLFDIKIKQYINTQSEIESLKQIHDLSFLRINAQPIKQAMGTWVTKWMYLYTGYIQSYVSRELVSLFAFLKNVDGGLDVDATVSNEALMTVMAHIRDVRFKMVTIKQTFGPLKDMVMLLKSHGITLDLGKIGEEGAVEYLERAPLIWDNVVNKSFRVKEEIHGVQNAMVDTVKKDVAGFKTRATAFYHEFKKEAPFSWKIERRNDIYDCLSTYASKLEEMELENQNFNELEELFELSHSHTSELIQFKNDITSLKDIWAQVNMVQDLFTSWQTILWANIKTEDLLDEVRLLQNQVRKLPKHIKEWGVSKILHDLITNMAAVLPLVHELHSPSMRDRHWKMLSVITRKHFDKTPAFAFSDLLSLDLFDHVVGVSDLVEISAKELKVEKKLLAIESTWSESKFTFTRHKDSEVYIIASPDDILETLEAQQMDLQTMIGMGKFVDFFRSQVVNWQADLSQVETVLKLMVVCQRGWTSLESIFLGSQDIRTQLPGDTRRFEVIDTEFKEVIKDVNASSSVFIACETDGREQMLLNMKASLEKCQKALNEYLDTKKNIFPRFYFVSNAALLDILSNGNNAPKVMPHLRSIYDGIGSLTFVQPEIIKAKEGEVQEKQPVPNKATSMIAKDGEIVAFEDNFKIAGAVENWMNKLTIFMQNTLRNITEIALKEVSNWDVDTPRETWAFDYPGQIALLACQVVWTEETTTAIEEYESGQEDSIKKYAILCASRLESLIKLVQGELSSSDRTKIIVLITIDVHSRDVVNSLIQKKVDHVLDFAWQSQLKFFWLSGQISKEVSLRINDFKTSYSYEYVGNVARLVITPLTDRCYVTLTTALRLNLGGAPAGPAGTGKTETTKDLARALGLPCYVFNCSDQMNYQSMADIFKGLAQVGAWGCFDEFNRIEIEVLSVVASQVKYVLDAIVKFSVPLNRENKYVNLPAGTPPTKVGTFDFFGDAISLIPTCGFFITMNPGYAGRTELPENLKSQFRSCAMIRPDLKPICENMLMSEGFIKAGPLSIKFVTLYELCSELLSKQAHYDWGLRAVKSVLRVAGNLKREDTKVEEDVVLMRALRDFNTPKIPMQDMPIFLRLISDLFPGLNIAPKINESLKVKCQDACAESNLQSDPAFVQKITQFQELLDVRHSVMLLGPAGAGKTSVWKTLQSCLNQNQSKPVCVSEVVNPKAVTSDELYGHMTFTKDWKDGVLSIIMRNMSKCWAPYSTVQSSQWVVLDGDIDAVWIESMNTVMDDNKVLTLVSNERIPLTDPMRMIFEVNSLKNATPATVSRAGILYLNDTDIGYQPFIDTWISSRTEISEREVLPILFSNIVPAALELFADNSLTTLVPVTLINVVQTICYLMEGLLPQIPRENKTSGLIEKMLLYSTMWAIGGTLTVDRTVDCKKIFSVMWKSVFKALKYPDGGTIFDYCIDARTGLLSPWADKVEKYTIADVPFSSIVVQTVDSIRLTSLADTLLLNKRHVLFVGGVGTGKTTLVKDYLKTMDENTLTATINMNYYTDSAAIQQQLEQPIDKRSGKIFGPPTGKKLIYFVDDLNMARVETYGTQTPIELIRQHMDYGSWYDRTDLSLKKTIQDMQFVSCMNNKSGSFSVNPRLQRHFSTFACALPSDQDLTMIYGAILNNHLKSFNCFTPRFGKAIVDATITSHKEVSARFLPSAVKFHYNFNMRDLSSVVGGIVQSKPEYFGTEMKICRLWLHESTRVFTDRLITQTEISRCDELLQDVAKRFLDQDPDDLFAEPNIFTHFATSTITDEAAYLPITDMTQLKTVLESKLKDYNESNAIMHLVLFAQAMQHVTRIARILSLPGGNALLVGVGGSGKQSLAKLASFICGYNVVQISVTTDYGVLELKEELKELYRKAGVKPALPMVFVMNDSQIVDERFLVYVNDLLSSGVIPDLFSKDEYDLIFASLRSVAKAAGVQDTREAMMELFIDRVKSNLHVILCFSPVGEAFRIRSRRFPGLINCTAIDWFHGWPKDALVSVAQRFLENFELSSPEVKENVCYHVAEVHMSVNLASAQYLTQEKRHNYTTPKSFLELIQFYKTLLGEKRTQLYDNINRLDTGLKTLQQTNKDVETLKSYLVIKMIEVETKKGLTEDLLKEMGLQRTEAEAQQELAVIEKKRADKAAADAATIEAQADGDLKIAKPAMIAAKDAVDCLDKNSLHELKGFSNPPAGVDKVAQALLIMIKGEKKDFSWENAKKMMAKVDAFLELLQNYKGEHIPDDVVKRVLPLLSDPVFTYEKMKSKSMAAANLCNWVINIINFNQIYRKVKPLMASLELAKSTKTEAEEQLAGVISAMSMIEEKLNKLQSNFLESTEAKTAVEAEIASRQERLGLAERLTSGLSSENDRWTSEIDVLRRQEVTLLGKTLLSAAFVSYIGAFGTEFREHLWKAVWLPDLISREIPLSENIDPLSVLTNDATVANWQNEGLPADRISIENGAIITNAERWPLIIDPQLQGIKWIKAHETKKCAKNESQLVVLQLRSKLWMSKVIDAIQSGHTVIIENIGEAIDAVLDPILMRSIYRKGRHMFIKIGGEEVQYDPQFSLYLQTKLSNPHYKPEIAAQCTLVNFIVTEKGLEDQLLAKVVGHEEPALEQERNELVQAFNEYKIQLNQLEDDLLFKLANAPADILSDIPLIEGLEATKEKASEINIAVRRGKESEVWINEAREHYRIVSNEASMLYFMLLKLSNMNHMYQYSLDSFTIFFMKALAKAEKSDSQEQRVQNLISTCRWTVFSWVSRGLFEEHKLTFLSLLAFGLMAKGTIGADSGFNAEGMQFLLKVDNSNKGGETSPLDWLPDANWTMISALSEKDGFERLPADIEESSPRFLEWFTLSEPEAEKLPMDWRELDKRVFNKLMVVRALRPDRMLPALRSVIMSQLPQGREYVTCDSKLSSFQILEDAFVDSSPSVPIYFVLSPGADLSGNVDRLAKQKKMKLGESYFNISLGQGQDVIANERLDAGHKSGHWVVLNNVHLMPKWLKVVERKLDEYSISGSSHENFRIFFTSDPSTSIPIGLIERCIKLTNDPPSGLKANLTSAISSISKEDFEEIEPRTRGILFGLCFYHAIMVERKRFGGIGYNMMYPFAMNDLRDSARCLNNYMESAPVRIPWADLQFLFGEIMYGGHIVNDFDRLMSQRFLEFLMKDSLLDEMQMYPFPDDDKENFKAPQTGCSYNRLLEQIEVEMGSDSPLAFGLHPNAEIGFRTQQSEGLLANVAAISVSIVDGLGSGGEGGGGGLVGAESVLQDILEMFRDAKFDVVAVAGTLDEIGPFQNVFIQECERMNTLLLAMCESLAELDLGLKGDLTMTDMMEALQISLLNEQIPVEWNKLAFPSMRPLGGWLSNLQDRIGQLGDWCSAPANIPTVTWLSGLFNPQSFLTAIMQSSAQSANLELDKLSVVSEVSKKMDAADISASSRDGAFINGLTLEGARYDVASSVLQSSLPREMFCPMPIVNCKASIVDRVDGFTYFCPVYKTSQRGPTYVFSAGLRSKQSVSKWTLAGVAILLDPS